MLKENRTFRTLFVSYGLSTLGDWFDFIAVSILLGFVWKVDPMTMALLPVAYAAPSILLGQFAGVLADRVNKVRMIMSMNIMQAALTLLLLVMPNPFWFLVVIALRSGASVFNDPAQQTLTRQIVPENQLLQASALNGAVYQMGKLIGPLAGGLVAAVFAPAICLMINASTFLLSTGFLFTIRKVEKRLSRPSVEGQPLPYRQAWQEGWRIFLQNRVLLYSTIFAIITSLAIQLADTQFPVIFREKLPDNPEMLGFTVSVIGLGALVTVTWLHRLKEIRSYGWVLGGGVLLIGISFSWIGFFQPGDGMYWLLIAALLAGVGTGLTSVGTNYLVQKESPPQALGRVRGIIDSLTSATFIIAPLLGGVIMTIWGPNTAFLWVGMLIAVIGGGAILLQRWIWGKRIKDVAVSTATAGSERAG
ncbi:MFS transporter [Brevibacillus brevis]|uniref:MFS transporter n=1 Tax=Brevibacillus brevis TaxID=1393 RepID=UPI00165E8B7B|nr:MFS transporter [Brevibacillus brevis]